jgi:membrane-bound ClpP family serine protease
MQANIIYTYLPAGHEETTLIVFGFVFLLFELFIVSYGFLTIMGLLSLSLGFYHIYMSPEELNSFKHSIIWGTAIAFLISFGFLSWWLRKDAKKHHRRDFFEYAGKTAIILSADEHTNSLYHYTIRFRGEIWKAQSTSLFQPHEEVEIIQQIKDTLILEIKPRG